MLDGTDSVLTEISSNTPKKVALMFEFDGDVKGVGTAYTMLPVKVTLKGSTKADKVAPETSDLTMTAAPRPYDGVVKRSTTSNTEQTQFTTHGTPLFIILHRHKRMI